MIVLVLGELGDARLAAPSTRRWAAAAVRAAAARAVEFAAVALASRAGARFPSPRRPRRFTQRRRRT